jgi:hypothetical protein
MPYNKYLEIEIILYAAKYFNEMYNDKQSYKDGRYKLE